MNSNHKLWKVFYVHKLFETKVKSHYATKLQVPTGANILRKSLQCGDIPRITVTSRNNGIDGFYVSKHPNYRSHKNFISVSFLGTVFYHPYKASIDMKVHCLKLKNKTLNVYIGKFLVTEIRKNLKDASYGNQISSTDLPNKKILVPVNLNGEVDWEYMEQFIKKLQNQKLNNYKKYIQSVIEKNKYKKIKTPKEKKWKAFEIGKLFELYTGKSKGLNHLTKTDNGINYLGATNRNNGVLCQVEKKDYLVQKGNCIAFIRNGEGSMGYSVYKAENFIATSDVTVGYADFLNRYTGLFISTVSDKVRGKYNFGYKRSDTRLKKEKILLPINEKNEPDFEYMEQYIKNIEFEKIQHYLSLKFG